MTLKVMGRGTLYFSRDMFCGCPCVDGSAWTPPLSVLMGELRQLSQPRRFLSNSNLYLWLPWMDCKLKPVRRKHEAEFPPSARHTFKSTLLKKKKQKTLLVFFLEAAKARLLGCAMGRPL